MSDMHRRSVERLAGRIEQISGHWEAAEPPADIVEKLRTKNDKGQVVEYTSEDDRKFRHWIKFKDHYLRLVHGPAVWCNNPEHFVQWPEFKEGIASIELSFCRKCPFYRKATRQRRYPTCAQRANPNPEKAAALEFLVDLQKATNDAKEIMK